MQLITTPAPHLYLYLQTYGIHVYKWVKCHSHDDKLYYSRPGPVEPDCQLKYNAMGYCIEI